jgi:hypothetical protein
LSSSQSFPGPRPDVHGPPFRRALAFLGSGFGGSSRHTANRVRQSISLHDGIASLEAGKSPGRHTSVAKDAASELNGSHMGSTPGSFSRIVFVAAIVQAIAGCANQAVWVKPGAAGADFEVAKGHCLAAAYSQVPSAPAVATFGGGYQSPMVTNCTAFGASANCITTGGQYTPPVSVPYDANSSVRTQVYKGCMYADGWTLEQQGDVTPVAADSDWSKGLKWGVQNGRGAACDAPPADIANATDWTLGCRSGQKGH